MHYNFPQFQHLGRKVEVFSSGKRFISIPAKELFFGQLNNVSNKTTIGIGVNKILNFTCPPLLAQARKAELSRENVCGKVTTAGGQIYPAE